jgi:hypothetical protein
MFERNYFGMMMVETGEADAFITGLYTKYSNTIKVAKEVIGIQSGYKHFGTMHILNSKKGTYFLADTLINRHPDTETLIDIAKLSKETRSSNPIIVDKTAPSCAFLHPQSGDLPPDFKQRKYFNFPPSLNKLFILDFLYIFNN